MTGECFYMFRNNNKQYTELLLKHETTHTNIHLENQFVQWDGMRERERELSGVVVAIDLNT